MNHGVDVCEFCENIVKQCRCMGPHERIKRGVCAQCLAKGRRPMTQAEKDAEIAKMPGMSSQQALVQTIRDAMLDGEAKYDMTSEIATRIIEIVRAHDAKQKAGE